MKKESFDTGALTSVEDKYDKALVIEIDGHKLPWKIDGLSLERASDRGVELGEIISSIAKMEQVMNINEETEDPEDLERIGFGVTDFVRAMARLVWIGVLRFEPEAKLQAVLGLMDFETASELPIGKLVDRIQGQVPDEEAEGHDEGEAGKA